VPALRIRRQIVVEFGHCDPAGLIHIASVFRYFDTSTWLLFETALAVKQQDFSETYGVLPLVEVRADMLKPLRFGDAIEIESGVGEFRRSSFRVDHRISAYGEIAVEGFEMRVWAKRRSDSAEKISAAVIPDDIIARFN
jgi:4-hydroxybenzoyl-CoA thioesterase